MRVYFVFLDMNGNNSSNFSSSKLPDWDSAYVLTLQYAATLFFWIYESDIFAGITSTSRLLSNASCIFFCCLVNFFSLPESFLLTIFTPLIEKPTFSLYYDSLLIPSKIMKNISRIIYLFNCRVSISSLVHLIYIKISIFVIFCKVVYWFKQIYIS